jgi:hypothetical protein
LVEIIGGDGGWGGGEWGVDVFGCVCIVGGVGWLRFCWLSFVVGVFFWIVGGCVFVCICVGGWGGMFGGGGVLWIYSRVLWGCMWWGEMVSLRR